jgi:hypothetical protein
MNSHLPSSPDPAHSPSVDAEPLNYDPVYLQSRRELGVILVLFLTFFVWSVGVCYWLGYDPPGSAEGTVAMIWGMPTWVFWGILVPWLAVDVAAVWFCFFVMKDDDLGETHEGEDVVRQVQHEAVRKLQEQHGAGEEGPSK